MLTQYVRSLALVLLIATIALAQEQKKDELRLSVSKIDQRIEQLRKDASQQIENGEKILEELERGDATLNNLKQVQQAAKQRRENLLILQGRIEGLLAVKNDPEFRIAEVDTLKKQ